MYSRKPLKQIAIDRLEKSKEKVKDFSMIKKRPELLEYTLNQIQDNINFIKANDLSHLWKDCIEFNKNLDRRRNQKGFEQVTPEFRKYV